MRVEEKGSRSRSIEAIRVVIYRIDEVGRKFPDQGIYLELHRYLLETDEIDPSYLVDIRPPSTTHNL